MTISQPSKLVYAIDIPQVTELAATFTYNFFTPDECTNDSGGVPVTALARPAATIDASFIQWSLTRVPREVNFTFRVPKVADPGNTVSAQTQRDNANSTTGAQNGSLIADNLNKVIDEDFLASHGYVSVSFHDGEIDSKVHYLVSGTLATQTLESEHADDNSHYKASQQLLKALPSTVSPHFVTRALTQPDLGFGAQFYSPKSSSGGRVASPTGHPKATQTRFTSAYFDRLKKVVTNVQLNSKLMQDMVNGAIVDPTSPFAGDVVSLHQYAKQAKQSANQRFSAGISANDYKTYVPFISAQKQSTSVHHSKYTAQIVGYIIDKFEVLADGSLSAAPPIVLDSPTVSSTADFQVKFHANYCYAIRTVALLTLPAIDDSNNDVATVQVLISSKPSNRVYVSTTKLDAPPPPGDVDLVWNYETNQLLLQWAFPVWSQRDIKQFQVFRRTSVDHPFQLQKVYNFDDSAVVFPSAEQPDPTLVEYLTSPCQYYVDEDFDWQTQITANKGFIYSIACIDAHGLTSTLSAQYRVWFDPFKNALQKEHVSHLGAPKPYPNLYLDGDVFVDTIKVSGDRSKRVKLYFNPEYYYLIDDQNKTEQVVATQQTGGSYRLQFINLDNGKASTVDISINDQLTVATTVLSTPQVTLGPKRKNTVLQRSVA